MKLEIVFITMDGPFVAPTIISILEENNTLSIKSYDIIDLQHYGLQEPDQGAHIWRFDPLSFAARSDFRNKSGIFPLDGYAPNNIVSGVGIPPVSFGPNLHMERMEQGGLMNHFFKFGSGDDFQGRVGFLVVRRENDLENAPSLLFMMVKPTFHVQTNFPYTVVNSLEEAKQHLHTPDYGMPVNLYCDIMKTCSGPIEANLTVTSKNITLPEGLDYFYIRTDKGTVTPDAVEIKNGAGKFIFDPSMMSVGETATIKVGVDGMVRHRQFQTRKV